jgi:hypothetical protein
LCHEDIAILAKTLEGSQERGVSAHEVGRAPDLVARSGSEQTIVVLDLVIGRLRQQKGVL